MLTSSTSVVTRVADSSQKLYWPSRGMFFYTAGHWLAALLILVRRAHWEPSIRSRLSISFLHSRLYTIPCYLLVVELSPTIDLYPPAALTGIRRIGPPVSTSTHFTNQRDLRICMPYAASVWRSRNSPGTVYQLSAGKNYTPGLRTRKDTPSIWRGFKSAYGFPYLL